MKSNQEIQQDAAAPNNTKLLAILFGVLFLLALAGAIYLYSANSKLKNQSSQQMSEIEALDMKRAGLEKDLESIQTSFSEKITENEDLSATLTEKLKEVETLEWRVKDARKKLNVSKEENEEIKNRLAQLETLRQQLEADIADLAGTNTQLKMANEEVQSKLASTTQYAEELNERLTQMTERNSKLIDRLYTIAPAGFTADNFIVTAKKKNEKLTAKAKYVNEVEVSFDLNDVPAEFHRDEEIYLVLTKFDGQPVASIPTKTIRISAQEPFDIKAADTEKVKLNNRQHLEMSVGTDKDLESGMYNLLVYAKHGFLGATSFQLR